MAGEDTRQLVTAPADELTESTDQVIGGQAVSDFRRLADAAPERVASADWRGCLCRPFQLQDLVAQDARGPAGDARPQVQQVPQDPEDLGSEQVGGRGVALLRRCTQEKIARKTTACRIPAAIEPKWLWKM